MFMVIDLGKLSVANKMNSSKKFYLKKSLL